MGIRRNAGTFVFRIIFVGAFCIAVFGQPEREYQAQKQAESLVPILVEAGSVEDPTMRALIRFTCLEVIYDRKTPALIASVETELDKFYTELGSDRGQVSPPLINNWQNRLLAVLRRSHPAIAKRVEAIYLKKADTSSAELQEISTSKKFQEPLDRTLEKLRQGIQLRMLAGIEETVRKLDPAAADRLLNAAFEESEKLTSARPPVIDVVMAKPREFLDKWAPANRTRYLKFIKNFAKANAAKPDDDAARRWAKSVLRVNIENFKLYAPELASEAEALQTQMAAKPTPLEAALQAANKRIASSTDKLAQTLTEAESATDKAAKLRLLIQAANHAARAKEYRRAIEIAESARSFQEGPLSEVDNVLWFNIARPATNEKAFETAYTVITAMRTPDRRAGALAELASMLARSDRQNDAVLLVRESYKLLEGLEAPPEYASAIFQPVYAALISSSSEAFDAVRRSVALANRLPEPKEDQKPGGKNYTKYADTVLLPVAYGIGSGFGWITPRDASVAEFRAQEIKYKPWKLLALIAIERNRPHTVPLDSLRSVSN